MFPFDEKPVFVTVKLDQLDEREVPIAADLRDVMTGEIVSGMLERSTYASDAGMLYELPTVVVRPRQRADLPRIVRLAAEKNTPIHPRGAGTQMLGGAIGDGMVIDTSRFLNRIEWAAPNIVRVDAGVRLYQLKDWLISQQRKLEFSPWNHHLGTIGGLLAGNVIEPQVKRRSALAEMVRQMTVVLVDGTRLTLRVGQHEQAVQLDPLTGKGSSGSTISPPEWFDRIQQLQRAIAQQANAISCEQSSHWPRVPGYDLRRFSNTGLRYLSDLFIGSEGTLGLIEQVDLELPETPAHRAFVVVCFSNMESASIALQQSPGLAHSAVVIDRRLIALVREQLPIYRRVLALNAESALIIECVATTASGLQQQVERLRALLTEQRYLYSQPVAIDGDDADAIRELTHRADERLMRQCAQAQPLTLLEGLAVSPSDLPKLIRQVQDIFREHDVTGTFVAYPLTGILRARPLLDLLRPNHQQLLAGLLERSFDAVSALGGSITGLHGFGRLRSYLARRQSPTLYPIFQQIKNVFDPDRRWNPGKIVTEEASFPDRFLRQPTPTDSPAIESAKTIPMLTLWNDQLPLALASRCNGCGHCASVDTQTRMCPIHHADPREETSPRSLANVVRQSLNGTFEPGWIATDNMRHLADSCTYCKMCKLECPSQVDIARLMLEAKSQYLHEFGQRRTDLFFTSLHEWSAFASRSSRMLNPLLGNPVVRWLLEHWIGLSRHRRMPRFSFQTFLRQAAKRRWTLAPRASVKRPKVALFVDTHANFCEPSLGILAGELLERLGYVVYVPSGQQPSGMASLQYGDVETARVHLKANLEIFTALAREGFDIVTLESSSALVFRDDAKYLIVDPDFELMKSRTFELSEFLARPEVQAEIARQQRQALPINVAVHEPCHQRVLWASTGREDGSRMQYQKLMLTVPALQVMPMELGCTGMAGTYGLCREGFANSMKAGAPIFAQVSNPSVHLTIAQCPACRMQLEQATGKRSLHPAVLVAISLGLVEQPRRWLERPIGKLIEQDRS